LISFDRVVKKYNNTTIIDNVSFNIQSGEFFVIIGPSGSGKTTLLKMINRMENPTEGKILIDDMDISQTNSIILRRKIGYVIQSIGLLPHMDVEENVSIVPKLLKKDKNKTKEIVKDMLNLVGLDYVSYLHKYPYQLSGGEAQRVGIARALAADPPIILMDEPFGALDPITKLSLQNSISKIHRELKKTIVFVTHDIDEAIKIGQKIAIIKDGKIIQADTPQSILTNPKNSFVASFLGSDRALKKLSKLFVGDFVKNAESVSEIELNTLQISNQKYVWVVNQDGVLKGWLDLDNPKKNLKEIYIETGYEGFALRNNDTLKDAVSKMVWESVRTLPVCDSNGKLIGQIDLLDIITKT
jgi:osmoprotectant transport system ATP-binding protein